MGGEDPDRDYIGAVGGRRRQTSGSGRAGIVGVLLKRGTENGPENGTEWKTE